MDDRKTYNGLYEYTYDSNGRAKVFAILAYFNLLFLLGMLIAPEKNNPYVKNHVNNGILNFIAALVFSAIMIVPIIGPIIGGLGDFLVFVSTVIGIIFAVQGKVLNIPFLDRIKFVK